MDLTGANWHKSSHSSGNGGACVEVAVLPGAAVIAVRDSKNPHGPALLFSRAEWHAFTAGACDGEFDLASRA
jgi:hypothetical protein